MDTHEGWIAFGDQPTQILHPDTASAVLKMWCKTQAGRRRFGTLLREVLITELARTQ